MVPKLVWKVRGWTSTPRVAAGLAGVRVEVRQGRHTDVLLLEFTWLSALSPNEESEGQLTSQMSLDEGGLTVSFDGSVAAPVAAQADTHFTCLPRRRVFSFHLQIDTSIHTLQHQLVPQTFASYINKRLELTVPPSPQRTILKVAWFSAMLGR